MLLYYFRHGDPIYNPDGLTSLGEEQAKALAQRLVNYNFDRIFASTSNRAIQTAKPISELLKKEITLLDFSNEKYACAEFTVETENGEKNWAFFDNRTRVIFADRKLAFNDKWYEDERFADSSFKSGIKRVNENVDEFLLSLGYKHDREKRVYESIKPNNENVAFFAHGGFGCSFLSSVLDIPYPAFSTNFACLGCSSMTIIEFENKTGVVIPRIITYSNDGHLYKEGLV